MSTGHANVALVEAERPDGANLTAVIAERVKALRGAARLSGPALAAAMNERGIPWNRTTVAKLETGRRESLTVPELLSLALVLDVPPVLLVADPRRDAPVPVADGVAVDPWSALLWMIGASTINGGITSHPMSSTTAELIWQVRQVAEWAGAIGSTPVRPGTPLRVSSEGQGAASIRHVDDVHRGYLEMIAGALERIEELGAPAPQLGPTVLKRAAELDIELPGQEG